MFPDGPEASKPFSSAYSSHFGVTEPLHHALAVTSPDFDLYVSVS